MAAPAVNITDDTTHNGHCAGCYAMISRIDTAVKDNAAQEEGRFGRIEGQLGLIVKLVLAAITGIGGIAMLWLVTMVST